MKKYFLMLLAASTLCLGFTACGDDEEVTPKTDNNGGNKGDNGNNGNQGNQDTESFDYAEVIGMNMRQIIAKYGEPTMGQGTFYAYQFQNQKVSSLTLVLNPENQQVYNIIEILSENAYTAQEIQNYFAGKYTFYGEETFQGDEELEEEATVARTYGNAQKAEDATLLITVTYGAGEMSIAYVNPKNAPVNESGSLADLEPIDIIGFIGQSFEDIDEEYEGAFSDLQGMIYASCEDNDWLNGLVLDVDEEGIVTGLTFFFDVETAEVLNYFRGEGWEISDGEVTEDGPTYLIVKGDITIDFDGEMGSIGAQESNTNTDAPTAPSDYDCAKFIGMTAAQFTAELGEASMSFGTFYAYMYEEATIESISLMLNEDKVYSIMEILAEGAYTSQELYNHFNGKYTLYDQQNVPGDDKEGIAPSTNYTFGNAANPDDATLVIEVYGTSSISYSNPKNAPADSFIDEED